MAVAKVSLLGQDYEDMKLHTSKKKNGNVEVMKGVTKHFASTTP